MRRDQHTHQVLQNPRVGTSVLQLRSRSWWESDHNISHFTELQLVSAEVADNLQCPLPPPWLQSSFFQTMRTHPRDYLPGEKLFQLLQTLARNSKAVYQVHFYDDVKYARSIPRINYTKKSLAFRFCLWWWCWWWWDPTHAPPKVKGIHTVIQIIITWNN